MRLYLFSLLVMLVACQSKEYADFGNNSSYFPPIDHLKEGVVNKYYEHYTYNDGQAPLIIITYIVYQINEAGKLVETYYGGGFDLRSIKTYHFDSSMQILDQELFIYNLDTLESEILSNVSIDWNSPKSVLTKIKHYPKGDLKVEAIQMEFEDKVFEDNKKAKSFEIKQNTFWNGENSKETNSNITYLEGVGRFSEHSEREELTINAELIEQLSLEEFEKRKNHGLKRVGFIDINKILDDKGFEPCGAVDTIRDYYNPEGARYYSNKNGLEKEIRSKLNRELLKDESGYFTFHYVVNCDGKTGWFVSEGVDFNYQPKEFDVSLRDHLFSIINEWGDWSPVTLKGVKQDAYMYITFKIKDGEITDILP